MKIQVDNLFLIGKSHKVCQDYTLSGFKLGVGYYAIVCDGCSSSENTDVGARLLALSAMQSLDIFSMGYRIFGETVIKRADALRYSLDLDRSCLDATLLICVYDGIRAITYVYGDGYVIEKEGDTIRLNEYKFDSGAPYYLSYWLDLNRRKGYQEQFRGDLAINHYVNHQLEGAYKTPYASPIDIEHDTDHPCVDAIILSTDGLDSFSGAMGPYLKAYDVYEGCTRFKNTAGEFLKRRATKHCEMLAKENKVFHQDDLGMAAILFLQEE